MTSDASTRWRPGATRGFVAKTGAGLLAALLMTACANDTGESGVQRHDQENPVSETQTPAQRSRTPLQRQVDTAKADLARRMELDVEAIEVLEARNVTWRDGSMGCPKPDRGYAQVLTPGVRIRLGHGKRSFEYHGSRVGDPFLCEPPGVIQSPAPVADDGT